MILCRIHLGAENLVVVHSPVNESVVAVGFVVASAAEIAFAAVHSSAAVVLPLAMMQAYFHLHIEEVGATSSSPAECPVSSLV